MGRYLLAAIAVSIGITAFQVRPPEQSIVRSKSTLGGTATAKASQEEAANAETMKAILARTEQQTAQLLAAQENQSNQGIEVERKLVKYTGALVWVGVLQGVVLLLTVLVMRRQTNFFRNSERAWILLGEFGEERHNFKKDGIDILLNFHNYGKTPAWIVELSFCFRKVTEETNKGPLEYEPPTVFPYGEPVPPGKPYPSIRRSLLLDRDLLGRPYDGIYIFYGFIRYRDVFYERTRKRRETRVRMRYERTQMDVGLNRPGRWLYDGPPEANRQT